MNDVLTGLDPIVLTLIGLLVYIIWSLAASKDISVAVIAAILLVGFSDRIFELNLF